MIIISDEFVFDVGDFFLLLFVCLQWQVFRTEAAFHSGTRSAYDGGSARSSYEGGSNEDILAEVEHNMPIPGEDFTTVHQ